MNSNVLKEVVERFNYEVIRDGNRESFEALMSPDFVNWSAPSEGARGAETMWATFASVLCPAIAGIEVHIHEQLCDGDKVTRANRYLASMSDHRWAVRPRARIFRST